MHVLGILYIVLILSALPAVAGATFAWISDRVHGVGR